MPTGYTADIYDGKDVTLKDLLAGCARGMGLYVMQRDEPSSEPLKPREVSTYNQKSLVSSVKDLVELSEMSEEDLATEVAEANDRAILDHREAVVRQQAMRQRYDTFIEKVNSLDWPDDGEDGFYRGFKRFVTEQLEESRKFDCHEPGQPVVHQDPEQWRRENILRLLEDIKRCAERQADEYRRTWEFQKKHYDFIDWLETLDD